MGEREFYNKCERERKGCMKKQRERGGGAEIEREIKSKGCE